MRRRRETAVPQRRRATFSSDLSLHAFTMPCPISDARCRSIGRFRSGQGSRGVGVGNGGRIEQEPARRQGLAEGLADGDLGVTVLTLVEVCVKVSARTSPRAKAAALAMPVPPAVTLSICLSDSDNGCPAWAVLARASSAPPASREKNFFVIA